MRKRLVCLLVGSLLLMAAGATPLRAEGADMTLPLTAYLGLVEETENLIAGGADVDLFSPDISRYMRG